jgi:signal transduction histidine kinase
MRKLRQWQAQLLRSRWLAVLVIGLTLVVLGTTVWLARLRLRAVIRAQIAGRDGEVLYNAVQLLAVREEAGEEMLSTIEDPGEQFNLILKASRMKGVLAVRLFTPQGNFANGLPADVIETRLDSNDLAVVRQLKPVGHFYPARSLSQIFYVAQTNDAIPLLEVNVPLHLPNANRLAGVAQFILEGHGIAAEYAKLDRNLTGQALAAFAAGGTVLLLALGWAFRRLAERTANLQQANQQLALAARTSAVGAVTAHLIHGLKNPLGGLQTFVATRGGQDGDGDPDWEQAVASTRRMQALIAEVVAVLREEQAGQHYELTVAELAEIVSGRVANLVKEKGIVFVVHLKTELTLSNRVANLTSLILVNLLQNAVQATPAGRRVELEIRSQEKTLAFEVRDEGPGLPAAVAQNLFAPCTSARRGGSGIGLAISKQLANHLGAALELKSTSAAGCCFVLALPESVLKDHAGAAPPA